MKNMPYANVANAFTPMNTISKSLAYAGVTKNELITPTTPRKPVAYAGDLRVLLHEFHPGILYISNFLNYIDNRMINFHHPMFFLPNE